MKFWKKLCIFVILSLVLCMTLATVSLATDAPAGDAATEIETEAGGKLDMDSTPEDIWERAQLALQGTVTGMIMVFAVLGLLAVIVSLSKFILNRDQSKNKNEAQAQTPAAAPTPAPVATPAPAAPAPTAAVTDDGELAAVITAAIAAMIESGDYKNEFVGGFRVVSFKRTTSGAWNRK